MPAVSFAAESRKTSPDGQKDGADLLGLLLRLRALAAAWRAGQHNHTQRARHQAARTALRAVPLSQMEEVTGSMLDAAKSGDSNKLQVSRDVVLAALSQPLHACMRGIGERGHE